MSTDRRDVYFLVNMFPGKLIVDYECPHEGKKAKHHCDYSKPFKNYAQNATGLRMVRGKGVQGKFI